MSKEKAITILNKGEAIYHYEIKLDFIKNKAETKEETYSVLDSNIKRLVINDEKFTRLQYENNKNYNMDTPFNVPQAYKVECRPSFDYVYGYIYTTSDNKKKCFADVKKKIEEYLYDKYGRYCNGIELLKDIVIN